MQLESRIQKSVVDWFGVAASGYHLDPRLLSHAANGGKRGAIEAAIFKGMGVRAGHEDLFLAVARGDKHGLYLELKSPDGRLSPEQREMMKLHVEQGYCVTVAWSANEGISAIVNYLRVGDPLSLK